MQSDLITSGETSMEDFYSKSNLNQKLNKNIFLGQKILANEL